MYIYPHLWTISEITYILRLLMIIMISSAIFMSISEIILLMCNAIAWSICFLLANSFAKSPFIYRPFSYDRYYSQSNYSFKIFFNSMLLYISSWNAQKKTKTQAIILGKYCLLPTIIIRHYFNLSLDIFCTCFR